MTRPCDLTATEAQRLILARQLSPVDLLESCIEQIEAINPSVNAVVTKAYDQARTAAQAAASAVSDGKPLGLLHGLPVVIKDLNDTKDIRTTYGSPLYKDHVPDQDDPVVSRIRRQGGVIVGKTNTPEFDERALHMKIYTISWNRYRGRCWSAKISVTHGCSTIPHEYPREDFTEFEPLL